MKRSLLALMLCATVFSGVSMINPVTTPVKAETIVAKKTTKAKKKKGTQMEIVDSGYYLQPGNEFDSTNYAHFWAKIHNKNKKQSITLPSITATAKDDSGKVLGHETQTGVSIAPNDTVVLTNMMDVGDTAPANVEIKAKKPKFSFLKAMKTSKFSVSNVSEVPVEFSADKVTGEITYKGKKELNTVAVTVMYKSAGKTVFADTTFVDDVEPKSTVPFEYNPLLSELPAHDSIEVYVQNWL